MWQESQQNFAIQSVSDAGGVSVNVQQVIANVVANGFNASFTISGWMQSPSYSVSGSGTASEGPGVATSLNGRSVYSQTTVITGNVVFNGTSIPVASSGTEYRNSADYSFVAENAGSYYLHVVSSSLPTTVRAGSTGTDATGNLYANSTIGTVIGTFTEAYVVTADTSSTLLVTFVQNQYNTAGAATVTGQTTYRVNTNGSVSLVSITATNTGAAGSTGGSAPFSVTYTF